MPSCVMPRVTVMPVFGDVGELDRVVRVRPDRVGEILADLVLRHVERGGELDVADVVAAEVDVHEAGDELVVRRVLVVLDALEERVGAVADADDRDADLVLRAGLAVLWPFVDAMVSFPSRSESVSTIRSLTLRLRCAARAASLSFSSAGMRSSTGPPLAGAFPVRPLGSNATAKREARMPTATSLRLRPERLTSSARRRLSSPGMRTRTSLRVGASTEVLAAYHVYSNCAMPEAADSSGRSSRAGRTERIRWPTVNHAVAASR